MELCHNTSAIVSRGTRLVHTTQGQLDKSCHFLYGCLRIMDGCHSEYTKMKADIYIAVHMKSEETVHRSTSSSHSTNNRNRLTVVHMQMADYTCIVLCF